MDKRLIVAIIILVVAVSAVLLYVELLKNDDEPPIDIEHVGGKYNATLSFWEDHVEIEYTDEDGKHSQMYFKDDMRDGLEWIRNNTSENATFLCWWDYGHMIKGYAERDSVVRNPSQEILDSVGDPSSIEEFDPHLRIVDVATALTTSNLTEMLQILDKYDVTHIMVCSDDLGKVVWFYRIAGMEESEYVSTHDPDQIFTDAGMETMIAKLLENRDTDFTLIHEDQEIKVYKVD